MSYICCPRCPSTLHVSVMRIRSLRPQPWWMRALASLLDLPIAPLVSVTVGDRVACQHCGHVFSIGPTGPFQHWEPKPSTIDPTKGFIPPARDDKPDPWKPSIPPPRPAPPL